MLPSGLADLVADDEDLARFLTSSGQSSSQVVKPSALLPHPRDRETSVFRHGPEPRESLLGLWHAEVASGRNLHAVAVFKARHVRAADLDVVATEPPPRHASIIGWPWLADPDLQKAQQKERALLIVRQAELLRP